MAVIKVFDANGVKTLVMLGNANEQEYDDIEKDDAVESSEEDDDIVDF